MLRGFLCIIPCGSNIWSHKAIELVAGVMEYLGGKGGSLGEEVWDPAQCDLAETWA